ncbi:MAG: hypothetical protein ACKVGW_11570, partial [Verrucomicrobiia bacterium]
LGLLSRRWEGSAREPNPPYIQASAGNSRIAREKEALQQSVVFIEDHYQEGLDALMGETNRAVRDGFTAGELERVKADVLRSLENAFDEIDKTNSNTYADEYTRAFTVDEPIPGIEMELRMTESFLADITVEEVNAIGNGFAQTTSQVGLFSGPEKGDWEIPKEMDLIAAVEQAGRIELDPYDDRFLDAPLLAEEPSDGSIVSESY